MAKHFAELNSENKVINVVVMGDDATDASVTSFYNNGNSFKEYKLDDSSFRLRPAVIGGAYDSTNDVFTDEKPFDSWTLNTSTHSWEAPTAEPSWDSSTHFVQWDEDNTRWLRDEVGSDGHFKDPRVQSYWNSTNSTWVSI